MTKPFKALCMNRRAFLSAMGVLFLSAVAPGCARVTSPLRIASHTWPGYEFMFLAQREGWIPAKDPIFIETASATESIQLLSTGKSDGAALTLDELLIAREKGLPLMAVLVFDISMGADVLLAKPGIDTLEQIKGKRIGFEQSAVGELMMYKALDAAGLRLIDVKTVPATFDRHLQVWRSGDVDALITFEPVACQLEAEDARRIFDSSKIPDTIFDVLVVTPLAVERHHDALEQLVAGHFRGLSNFRKNPYDTAYRMAEHLKLSPKETIGSFEGLELPNEQRNHKLLKGRDSPIVAAAKDLNVSLAKAGILKTSQIDLSNISSAEFVHAERAK